MIHLGMSADGRLVVATNEELHGDVATVVFYATARLFVFEYEDGSDEIMPLEMRDDTAWQVQNAPAEIVIVVAIPGEDPYGYTAQLSQRD